MPTMVMSYRGIAWANVAISGTGWAGLNLTSGTHLWPHGRPQGGDILVMNGGQSDILNGLTGAQVYDELTTYMSGARDHGFDYVIVTNLPAIGPTTGEPTWTPGMAVAAADLRTLTLANSAGADAVVDFYVDPIDDTSDITYWLTDHLHPTQATVNIMSELMGEAIDDAVEALT